MAQLDGYTQKALEHIRYLSQTLGGRGSCTPAERQAASYAAAQMHALGLAEVRLEPYRGAASTYRPYALAFAAALLGSLLAWLAGGRVAMALATLLGALSAWGMVVETDFSASWMRRLLPKADSQNALGVIPPRDPAHSHNLRRVVLCAHLDTHRTPIFYSSKSWHSLFSFLVAAAFTSLVVGGVAYGLAALFGWAWVRRVGLVAAVIQTFFLVLCLHADLTPFSTGANDDASGVGVMLALAERLARQPLAHTEVWLAFTGCEETMSHGIAAFLDAHAAELGEGAVYIVLDQVGLGQLMVLSADGLIVKRRTHPRALELARRTAAALPGLELGEHVGIAYTDAAVATKRGLIALTVDALPPAEDGEGTHWHQMSDTVDQVDPQTLADAHAFTWQILQEIDRAD